MIPLYKMNKFIIILILHLIKMIYADEEFYCPNENTSILSQIQWCKASCAYVCKEKNMFSGVCIIKLWMSTDVICRCKYTD
ncbi:hypothetical protein CHREV_292 [Choristoneura rosaceana entomopoxvirus 'L']|uniref:Uncharacterized protein n=1 Tax=Choristoneura rosaceana entomopoxvirus 'L' TaxID=1293539 RepID=A0ABM9QL36_9POXV|nr:hypothetical protein CHREV_005 [Choristoneura rosaceana entomopoxvirus 'L']YP_008004696.1 hypothetical protein CHREV_292 [Choristoneura rosaceana entomopoxvirus 'L']CCU55907.1 hypothetical protein CHREV_005 [Choristoneura rosaceana entomopoxvirus 'L']CCU56194.1 hypothetical protein CHREV_292 [Choristoneura rosaceana entomopoxvirus 'L']